MVPRKQFSQIQTPVRRRTPRIAGIGPGGRPPSMHRQRSVEPAAIGGRPAICPFQPRRNPAPWLVRPHRSPVRAVLHSPPAAFRPRPRPRHATPAASSAPLAIRSRLCHRCSAHAASRPSPAVRRYRPVHSASHGARPDRTGSAAIGVRSRRAASRHVTSAPSSALLTIRAPCRHRSPVRAVLRSPPAPLRQRRSASAVPPASRQAQCQQRYASDPATPPPHRGRS